MVDTAIVAESFAPSPELEDALLESASADAVDDVLRARLLLLRLLSRLYYAGLLLGIGRARALRREPDHDLAPPTPAEFGAGVAQGRFKVTSGETLYTLGKMMLARFLEGADAPGFEAALAAVRVA